MYITGSYIVSTLSGMRFVDFVNKRIFEPLGMHSSTYSIDAAIQSGKFTGAWTYFGRLIPPWIKEEYVDLTAGPGGVISSVEELVRHCLKYTGYDSCLEQAIWTRVFLNGGVDPATNTTIIPSAEFNVTTSGHSIASPDTTAQSSTEVYGLGWARLSVLGHDVSERCPLYPVHGIILANRSFCTTEMHRGCLQSSSLLPRMASGLSCSLMLTRRPYP